MYFKSSNTKIYIAVHSFTSILSNQPTSSNISLLSAELSRLASQHESTTSHIHDIRRNIRESADKLQLLSDRVNNAEDELTEARDAVSTQVCFFICLFQLQFRRQNLQLRILDNLFHTDSLRFSPAHFWHRGRPL